MLFIYNPHSGKAQLKNQLSNIIDLFVKAGYVVTVHPTQEALDARRMAKENSGHYDLIVCSGGDGTINEVVDGVMECGADARSVLGYIPTGTVNDFASSLKLSKNVLKAAENITVGTPFSCDIGSFNQEYFTYIAAFGLFTDVAYQTPQQTKNMLGRPAYILEGMKRLSSIKPYNMRFETDEQVIEDEFLYGMVTNSVSVGGFKGICGKHVKLDDGLFEVTLIKMPKNVIELQAIINAVIKRESNPEYMYSFRTAKLHVTSEEAVEWTLDGEFGGSEVEVWIENHKQAVQIITTPKEK